MDDSHGNETHVEIGERHSKEREPGEERMLLVQRSRARPSLVLQSCPPARHAIVASADEVTERMTSERISRKQDDVGHQHDRADPDSQSTLFEERQERVIGEDGNERERKVERETMQILERQKTRLAVVLRALPRRRHRAGGRRSGQRTVVGLAIVITSEAKCAGKQEDQERRRSRQK